MSARDHGSLDDDWALAVADSGLSSNACLLEVVDRPPLASGMDCMLLDPGSHAGAERDWPLTTQQLARLNSERWRERYRVVLAVTNSRAVRLGLMRDSLERARQHREDPHIYALGKELVYLPRSVYGRGRGGASVIRMHPMAADAAAAGASFARKHAATEITPDMLWNSPHGSLLRTTWAPEHPATLPVRLLVWAALHRKPVEARAAECGGVEVVVAKTRPDLAASWKTLTSDAELALLARCAQLSVPSQARIDGSAQYPAAVWDRVVDLLDRGMVRGRAILASAYASG